MMLDIDVYMIDDHGGFQVDSAEGSFVFSPSRLAQGRVELREVFPADAGGSTHDALVSAIVSMI